MEVHRAVNKQLPDRHSYSFTSGQQHRSRLAHFLTDCQPDLRSASGCLKENYAECLLAYSGLIGTGITPNYLESSSLSVSPWCDCSNSGNYIDDCLKFVNFFKDNICLKNSIQAFGNGTDIKHQSEPSLQTTTSTTSILSKTKPKDSGFSDTLHITNEIPTHNGLPACANLQAHKLNLNDSAGSPICVAEHSLGKDNMVGRSSSNHISTDNSSGYHSRLCATLSIMVAAHSMLLALRAILTL
ncbi:GDNF family receptor alpha-1-like [Pelobates cultripes]|uniref:GDNF family receptor alpha-1-like n=1 Tax=Pelobates cultripes TaxID=61616 RepID=A0AAD1TEI8_PELCU|nr:GDNF family receptor alpha-1-like [Pelobates cultripes]